MPRDEATHELVAADVFEFLERAATKRRRFDLVISDPPSFAKSRDKQRQALRAYAKLTAAGLRVVEPGGLYAGASCTSANRVALATGALAPEQALDSHGVDARADVYSAGVVLAEMVSPDGVKSFASRKSLWEGVRSEPAQVPDSPWATVIQRAVAKDRERRQNSAHTLIRELEDEGVL